MKKILKMFVLVLAVCTAACVFTGCSKNHTVTFMTAKNISYTNSKGVQCVYVSTGDNKISVEDGEVIGSAPINPQYGTGDLYRFVGWFTEKECINQWDLYRDEVKSDLTLYPKYEKISLL